MHPALRLSTFDFGFHIGRVPATQRKGVPAENTPAINLIPLATSCSQAGVMGSISKIPVRLSSQSLTQSLTVHSICRILPRLNSTSIPDGRRNFSIEREAAKTFLTQQLKIAPSSVQLHSHPSPSGSESLSLLLHADRRPKSVRVDGTEKTHFGPALLVCNSLDLQDEKGKMLGAGDLGILKLQSQRPVRVLDVPISIEVGPRVDEIVEGIADKFELTADKASHLKELINTLWNAFDTCQGIWFSVRAEIANDGVVLTNPFLSFDPYALPRIKSPILQELYTSRERDPVIAKAEDGGLFYINLPNNGDIGSFGYGAGNAMGTMDAITNAGGNAANFLDGGGGANRVNSKLAMETLNSDKNISTIFVNTFGGITQTDVVAEGILDAVRDFSMTQTIVVRVKGTGSDLAKQKLRESGLKNFILVDDLKEAAQMAVRVAKEKEQAQ
ncbi:unnamed protein product [Sympodiomycopsis kandeliae]